MTFSTDAPPDNQGQGRSFSPTDLLCVSMGTCMMTIMGIAARRDGIDLAGTKVSLTKTMSAEPPRRIARVDVAMTLPSHITPEQRSSFERAALTCPVTRKPSPGRAGQPDLHDRR